MSKNNQKTIDELICQRDHWKSKAREKELECEGYKRLIEDWKKVAEEARVEQSQAYGNDCTKGNCE